MGSGLRPMIIISSTSISRSQPAFVLEVEIKEDKLRKGKAREVASKSGLSNFLKKKIEVFLKKKLLQFILNLFT